ncbi:hypothetical protein [Nocardia wallacei]|uniref:hypothetical protein n=1 Tax=Nocardia wallacei TaxID=480035 RepID=UPI0024586F26|nr:hypothetical protein [Nocardia wallacei]
MLLPLGAVTAVVRDGRAVVADAHTMMLRHAGAQSVTMSPSGWPEFPAQVTPGWRGLLTEADLLITADGWHGPVYDGAFGADQDWLVDASEQQRTCGGVIVVYAPVFAVDLLPAAIADGRLLAVRVPFTSMA